MKPAPRPDPHPIRPSGPLDVRLRPPGSRSITNRALLAAALARGESRLAGATESDDTRAMREGLRALGTDIRVAAEAWTVTGQDGRLRAPAGPVDVGASGTTARFLTAAATLADGPVVIDGVARMRERPIQELVDALVALGAEAKVLGERGCPPVRLGGGGLPGGRAEIDARRSSQYVSAILLAAPCAARDVELSFVEGTLVSRPFAELTLGVMAAFGAEAEWTDGGVRVRSGQAYSGQAYSGQAYTGQEYAIEPDAQSAVYGFAAAAIAGGRVCVEGIPGDSRQTEVCFVDALEAMGARVERGSDWIAVAAERGGLRGVELDMNDMPDAALALAVVALFAEGPTRLTNIANLRIKETDRLAALETELRRIGGRAEAGPDWLQIEPGPLHAADIDTYDDHRIAMSFALAGLRVPGVRIKDPGCVAKTWPDYFDVLEGW